MRTLFIAIALFLLFLCGNCSTGTARAGDELPPQWPEISTFTPGKTTEFRLPYFAGLFSYSDNDKPLYNKLYVPAKYDPKKAYPLCIRFQPWNNKPDPGELKGMSDGDAFVLGVSYPLAKPAGKDSPQEAQKAASHEYFFSATATWVISNFSIDRSRIFVGGFSAGGWAASGYGMHPSFRHLATHFVILSAGLGGGWGQYDPTLFTGRNAYVGAGTAEGNYDSAKNAVARLEKTGLTVMFVETPGGGHDIGPPVAEGMKKWYKQFDPKIHAADWLKDAGDLEKKDKEKACDLYARVAVLGPDDASGAAARAKLVELDGKSLDPYEKGVESLYKRNYIASRKAFTDAQSQAKKDRNARIMKLAGQGLVEIGEWQFLEETMAIEQTRATGQAFEAGLLARDGLTHFSHDKDLAPWSALFTKIGGDPKFVEEATAASKDKKRATVQQNLAQARGLIWFGGTTAQQTSTKKVLEQIATDFAGKAEALEAKDLLARLTAGG